MPRKNVAGLTILSPDPQPIDLDTADLRPLTKCVATLMAALERHELRRESSFSGLALWLDYHTSMCAAVQVEEELGRMAPNPTGLVPLVAGGTNRVGAIFGLHEALKFTRDSGAWTRRQGEEVANLAKLLAECRLFVDALKSEQQPKRRTGRPRNRERDSATKVIAALTLHHGFDSGSVTNYKPATNPQLAEDFKGFKLANNALSRFLADKLGEDGYKKYIAACHNEYICTLLSTWNGETPDRHAELHDEEAEKGAKKGGQRRAGRSPGSHRDDDE